MLGNAAHTGRAPAFAPVLPRPAATHRERVPMRRLPQIWLRRRLFSLRRLSTGWLGRGVRSDIERCIFGFVWGVQSLDRVAWPRCPLRHREVLFGFSWGYNRFNPASGFAGYARPPKTCRARLRQPCPASIISAPCGRLPGALRSRRRLAEARQGRASAAVVAAQIHGQAMRPWLSTPSCRRPYGAQPPNRPVIQSQTRAKKPEVSSVSASGSGVGAGETFGI